MAQHVITDEVGVRFGIGTGVLFVITGALVATGLSGEYGVVLLLASTTVLAVTMDAPHALVLGLAGWAFATGFEINTLGVLTLAPTDLARLGLFVVTAGLTGRLGGAA